MSRLTVEDCDEIRRLKDLGLTNRRIGQALGRAPDTVRRVLNGTLDGAGRGPGRVANSGVADLVEATVVPWAPWVPEPEVCAERVAALSVSQRHVLELLAAGYTFKQVARLRRVSESTARNLLNQAFGELGVANYGQGIVLLHRAQAA
jgi:DNA-binding CsgD family transcriptional regulator